MLTTVIKQISITCYRLLCKFPGLDWKQTQYILLNVYQSIFVLRRHRAKSKWNDNKKIRQTSMDYSSVISQTTCTCYVGYVAIHIYLLSISNSLKYVIFDFRRVTFAPHQSNMHISSLHQMNINNYQRKRGRYKIWRISSEILRPSMPKCANIIWAYSYIVSISDILIHIFSIHCIFYFRRSVVVDECSYDRNW